MHFSLPSRSFFFGGILCAALGCAGPALAQSAGAAAGRVKPVAPPSALPDLIATEYAFAADAQRHGMKVAFLASMHDSAVVFIQGNPTPAQAYWKQRPADKPNEPRHRWAPALAGISAANDLGYSTGPWHLTSPEGKVVSNGQFLTIWQRQPDGTFQWLLDTGVSSPMTPTAPPLPAPADVITGPNGLTAAAGKKPKPVDPRRLDEQLSTAIGRKGMPVAYQARLHPQAQLLREEKPALNTPLSIKKQLATDTPWRLTPTGSRVAASGELAYSYGRYQSIGGALQGAYVHVWLLGAAGWQLLLEASSPGPVPTGK